MLFDLERRFNGLISLLVTYMYYVHVHEIIKIHLCRNGLQVRKPSKGAQ